MESECFFFLNSEMRQECVISSCFFSLYMDGIMKVLEIGYGLSVRMIKNKVSEWSAAYFKLMIWFV